MNPRALGRLDDREIVAVGTIIVSSGQALEIYPFVDDKTFSIKIILDFTVENEFAMNYMVEGEDNVLRIRRPFRNNDAFANRTAIIFAEDADHDFYIKAGGSLIGKPDRYSFFFSYNILREEKKK